MTDLAWIHGAITAARPQAVGALLRYFRDMDRAEEAFQEACLRALKNWPDKGPPRDPCAWLILVGRNAALDGVRKQSRVAALPPDVSRMPVELFEQLQHFFKLLLGELFSVGQIFQAHFLGRDLDQNLVQLRVVIHVIRSLFARDGIERRLGDVNKALFHELRHLPVEESQEQGANV